jgi:maltose alpha-D-glucosyltransferase/alpha-amylase
VDSFLERRMAGGPDHAPPLPMSATELLERSGRETPSQARDHIGAFLESARLLGQRTAELHLCLSSDPDDPAFAPEPFTPFYQRSIYQSMRNHGRRAFDALRRARAGLPADVAATADEVLSLEGEVGRRLRRVFEVKVDAARIRHHGDFHLGQVLFTGKDFVLIDFEGEPARPLSERAIKRSPLRDVAGMIRSFHYASQALLLPDGAGTAVHARPTGDEATLRGWARFFYGWSSSVYLGAYRAAAASAPFLPVESEQLEVLLSAFLLEKALYEIHYELSYRPAWVSIPLDGLLLLLGRR